MYGRITAKRQVTFPANVIEALGVGPRDQLELEPGPDGYLLRPRRIHTERLAPLRNKLRRGHGTFDLERFREAPHDPSLRDLPLRVLRGPNPGSRLTRPSSFGS
jgi:bifunctional DNA-binding transcriptional regulator/antitoxin component of YhaV-PrlF toxin-antitoxin module